MHAYTHRLYSVYDEHMFIDILFVYCRIFFCFGIFVRFNVIVEISLFFASCVVGVVVVVALRHVSHELMTSKKLCWKKINPSILAMKEELIFWEKYFSGIFRSTFFFIPICRSLFRRSYKPCSFSLFILLCNLTHSLDRKSLWVCTYYLHFFSWLPNLFHFAMVGVSKNSINLSLMLHTHTYTGFEYFANQSCNFWNVYKRQWKHQHTRTPRSFL